MQEQQDYITLSRPMDEEASQEVLAAVARQRRASLGEAILTGGAAVDSINTYLQSLAAKAELKRKEHKKKRKERRALKDKKRSRKRSRSYTLPDPIIRHDDEVSAKTAQDERSKLLQRAATSKASSSTTTTTETTSNNNERLVAHTTIQTNAAPSSATSVSHHHHSTMPMAVPSHNAAHHAGQPQHPQHPVHSMREFSRSFPTLPLIHEEPAPPSRQAFQAGLNPYPVAHPGVGAHAGERTLLRPMPSLSMPLIPTLSHDLITPPAQQLLGLNAAMGEDDWHDASAMAVAAAPSTNQQQPWFGSVPSMPLAVASAAPASMVYSPVAFDDSLLNSFLSADLLQGDEMSLLSDLL